MTQAPLPTRIDMSDAPVDFSTLDELFPPDPVLASPQSTPADVQQTSQTPAPPAVNQDEPFVRGSNSVYKTREAAVEGINAKDAVIEQLRQQYTLVTGIDPLTKQPHRAQPENDNYATNSKAYADALRAAQTDAQLAAVQQKLIMDTIQPLAPALSGVTRDAATRQTRESLPDFDAFYNSAEYKATLEQVPSIRQAIETAENDIRYHPQLPELYKTAYLVSRGMQLPELLKRTSANSATSISPAGRPTATPTTPTPQLDTSSAQRTVRTSQGRKAIIADFESKNKQVLPW